MSSPSLLPSSLPAQSQVLEAGIDLLREVLGYLGPNVTDYHAPSLVSRTWNEALERYV